MIDYKTTFEATENLIQPIEIGHGENADLHVSIKDEGVEIPLSGYSVSAIYQPESKWSTSTFYSCPSEISGNEAIVHWSHTQDNGENAVKMWVRFEKGGKVSYPALYGIRLFKTPGFSPSTITPIPESIDFDVIPFSNAPWLLSDDFQGWVNTSYTPTVSTLSASSPEVITYTGSNKQEVKDFILSHPNAIVRWEAQTQYITNGTLFYRTANFEDIYMLSFSALDLENYRLANFCIDTVPPDEITQTDFTLWEVRFAIQTNDYRDNDLSLFALQSDLTALSSSVGNINTVLDSINGEVI